MFSLSVRPNWITLTYNTEDGPVTIDRDYFEIVCIDDKGYRWIGDGFDTEAEADCVIRGLDLTVDNPQVNPAAWCDADPVYGSEAYEEMGCEQAQLAREMYPEYM